MNSIYVYSVYGMYVSYNKNIFGVPSDRLLLAAKKAKCDFKSYS